MIIAWRNMPFIYIVCMMMEIENRQGHIEKYKTRINHGSFISHSLFSIFCFLVIA